VTATGLQHNLKHVDGDQVEPCGPGLQTRRVGVGCGGGAFPFGHVVLWHSIDCGGECDLAIVCKKCGSL
jgi:hypothetical protein